MKTLTIIYCIALIIGSSFLLGMYYVSNSILHNIEVYRWVLTSIINVTSITTLILIFKHDN